MATVIAEDTRNQLGKHENIRRYCEENGIRIVRSKLIVGDYSLVTSQAVCVDTRSCNVEVSSDKRCAGRNFVAYFVLEVSCDFGNSG